MEPREYKGTHQSHKYIIPPCAEKWQAQAFPICLKAMVSRTPPENIVAHDTTFLYLFQTKGTFKLITGPSPLLIPVSKEAH